MKLSIQAEDLMSRYLSAAERSLPIRERSEIRAEIELLILDSCEERRPEAEIDQTTMEEVLIRLGSPAEAAAKWVPETPLIGRELIPVFKLVLTIVCTVTAGTSLISYFLSGDAQSLPTAAQYFAGLVSSIFSSVGSIFIIFVILERLIPDKSEISLKKDDWKPSDLPENKEKLPGRAEIITEFILLEQA